MSRQRETSNLRRASVENMKENMLAPFHPHRLAVPQHPAVDREIAVADLVAVRHAFSQRRFHGSLARGFEFFDFSGRRQKILRHVPALAERRLKFLQHEKDFLVVAARFLLRLNINGTDLSAVLFPV